jgi:uncharacterized cupin superfamily protein
MTIYQPYFYIIQEISTGMYYAGAKWAKDANPNDFLTPNGYHTSSKLVKYLIEKNGLQSFKIRKIKTFANMYDTYEYETKFLKKVNAKSNSCFLNGHENNWGVTDNTNMVSVKNKSGENFKVRVDDPRYRSGEFFHNTKGKVVVKDENGNTFQICVDDPRFITKELQHVSKGTTVALDTVTGKVKRVSTDDFNQTKNLVGICNGFVPVMDTYGNKFSVNRGDVRFETGEIKHVTKGRVTVKSTDGKTMSIYTTDPRYTSGELVHNTTGMVSVKDKHGNTMQVSKKDPRYISGELVGVSKGIKRTPQITKCPHCSKSGAMSQMKRWHFENCKMLR